MANRWYTAASGNWSTTANWDGGVALPGAGDDVYADGKAIVIDQNVTVLSIRTTQRAGGTIGGTFTVNATRTITCTGAGIISGTALGGFLVTANSPSVVTINSSINGGGTANFYGTSITGTATVNATGDITGGNTTGNCYGLFISSTSILAITGNIYGIATSANGIHCTGGATIGVTGNVNGSTTNAGAGINNATAAATINITGNTIANVGCAIQSAIASVVTIIGTSTASNTIAAVNLTNASAIVTLAGSCVNANNIMAVQCNNTRIYASSIFSWKFQDEVGNPKYLYSAGVALGNPVIADVRNGTTYGAALELTGTLKVPPVGSVALGVPTDNTTGSAILTASDLQNAIWGTIASDLITSGSIGERLKNTATVQTVGDIVAALSQL